MLDAETRQGVIMRARRASSHLPVSFDRQLRTAAKMVIRYPGTRGSVRRELQFARRRRTSSLIITRFGVGHMVVDATDDEVARTVYVTGGYERVYMRIVVDYLRSRMPGHAQKGFIDVGANIGTSTLDALLHFGFERAVCLEPGAHNYQLLKTNLVLNGLDARASAYQVALSDTDTTANLERSPRNHGDHHLQRGVGSGNDNCERVTCKRFDALVDSGAVDLDETGLVWIDTQGHEPFVLEGAQSLVQSGVPVVVEYCPWALGSPDAVDDLERLIRKNYRTVVDVHLLAFGNAPSAEFDSADIGRLRGRYGDVEHTDLLLLQ